MDAAWRLQVLTTSNVFSRVPPDARRLLAEVIEVRRLPPRTIVFARGELADGVMIVAEGELGVRVGSAVRVRRLGRGAVVGEYGMVGDRSRTATVEVLEEPTTVLTMDYDRFRAFLVGAPEALWALFEIAVERLTELEAAVRTRGPAEEEAPATR